jgi:hypothetical protein
MKKLVIGLFVLGLSSLGFSQNNNGEVKEVTLKDVVLTNVNFSYLEKVQDKDISDHVILLQNEAAGFDVSGNSEFDGRNEPFKIIYRGSKGYIIAIYDNIGKIIKTREQYKDIKLPVYIMKSVLNQYPKSGLLKVIYTVSYNNQKEIKKTYKIQIISDHKKRNLKINTGDNLNKTVTMSNVN